MTRASSTMQESKMLSNLYAYNAYYFMFNDSDLVAKAVLKNFSQPQ